MLQDAIIMMRTEIGLTQNELAEAVYVSFSTVSRWENKGMRPNRLQSKAILDLAKKNKVSTACLESLSQYLLASRASDKEEKDRLRQVSEEVKLGQHDLLTAEQFRKTMDNIDIALLGQRFYTDDPNKIDIFYQNSFFVRSLGYTVEEYQKKVSKDPFFAVDPKYHEIIICRLHELLAQKIALNDFVEVIQMVRKDNTKFWLEVKAASLTKYSYGLELFTVCRDVTKRVEAERRLKEESLPAEVSMQVMFSNIHGDLTENKVTRYQNIAPIIGRDYQEESFEKLIQVIADSALVEADKKVFLSTFSRKALIAAYNRGDTYGNVILCNKNSHHWFRNEYLVVKNSKTGNLIVLIYFFDIQKQYVAENMLKIILSHFFDFVGLIDTDNELIESYYYNEGVFKKKYSDKRDYPAICAEKLKKYGRKGLTEKQSLAIDLRTVRAKLKNAPFYSVTLLLNDYDGHPLRKKITYTYLDSTQSMIIVAQSNLDTLEKYIHQYQK